MGSYTCYSFSDPLCLKYTLSEFTKLCKLYLHLAPPPYIKRLRTLELITL